MGVTREFEEFEDGSGFAGGFASPGGNIDPIVPTPGNREAENTESDYNRLKEFAENHVSKPLDVFIIANGLSGTNYQREGGSGQWSLSSAFKGRAEVEDLYSIVFDLAARQFPTNPDGTIDTSSGVQPDKQNYLRLLAHEVGHLLVGGGHPDQGGGPAILRRDYEHHYYRLMKSGGIEPPANSGILPSQLVKAEWDEYEARVPTIDQNSN